MSQTSLAMPKDNLQLLRSYLGLTPTATDNGVLKDIVFIAVDFEKLRKSTNQNRKFNQYRST